MRYISRPYAGPQDQALFQALARIAPEPPLHVSDLPYRLSSWALDRPENARLWFDATGTIRAWAMLQAPFWAVDLVVVPGDDPDLSTAVLSWAVDQARVVRPDPVYGRPSWFVSVPSDQTTLMTALATHGFTDQMHVASDPWSKVWLKRSTAAPGTPAGVLPAGYRVRELAGSAEVPAYVALHQAVFESKSMSAAWRGRTLGHARYRPELDLVVEAPDGALAGFCIGWFDPDGRGDGACGQIEPLGVAVGHRGRGLARALLDVCCERLRALGAGQTYVETDAQRDAALATYEAAGFRLEQPITVFRKDVEGG